MKNFINKYFSHMLLVTVIVKALVVPHSDGMLETLIILALSGLTGYKMWLNSIFDVDIKKQIKKESDEIRAYVEQLNQDGINGRLELHKEIEDKFNLQNESNSSIINKIDANHKQVDEALSRVTFANNEEIKKIKADLGQMNLAHGVRDGQQAKQKIFF